MDCRDMCPGELYLWAWCEIYLRFDRMIEEGGVTHFAELRTEDLNDPQKIGACLANLGLTHRPIHTVGRLNTNVGQGLQETRVDDRARETFFRFISRVPGHILDRIKYFETYLPTVRLEDDCDRK